MEPTVIKVEIDGDNIDIRYSDGSRERIEFGRYELRDADGQRIERHKATEDDYARLEDIAASFEGDTASDDGAPDQGSGDAPGTEGGDDSGGDDSGGGLVLIEGSDAGERIRGTRADERIEGLGGDDRLEGRGGDDEVRGGKGNDVLNGGSGNDDLWGNSGADTFVFADGGQDKIHDFEPGIDQIDVSAYGFADAAAVLASATEEGGDTFVDLGGGDLVKIDDITLAQLGEGDFIV